MCFIYQKALILAFNISLFSTKLPHTNLKSYFVINNSFFIAVFKVSDVQENQTLIWYHEFNCNEFMHDQDFLIGAD